MNLRWILAAVLLSLGCASWAAPAQACTGDCNGDREVTIDELISMVNIALGALPLQSCSAGDANGDGEITIDEIIQGVNFALAGCPSGCEQAIIRLSLAFDPNAVLDLAGVSLGVPFSSASLTIPADAVAERVRDVSEAGGFFNAQLVEGPGGAFDQELRISYLTPATLSAGALLEIDADCPAGANPGADSLDCHVTGASDSGGFPVAGNLTCSFDLFTQ